MCQIKMIIAKVFLLFFVLTETEGNIHTAVSELGELLHTQTNVMLSLESYINKEEDRIRKLKRMVYFYKREFKLARENETAYLNNPIRYFMLMKHLYFDLQAALDSVQLSEKHPELRYMKSTVFQYPTPDDLTGAARAILRMTDIYNLRVSDLVHGVLNGFHTRLPLSAGDCYEMGRELYDTKAYDYAMAWLSRALEKYYEEKNYMYMFNHVKIMEMIASGYAILERYEEAKVWIEEILSIDENNAFALQSKAKIKKYVLEPKGLQYVKPRKMTFKSHYIPKNESVSYGNLDPISALLCRGEYLPPPNSTDDMQLPPQPVCRYLISEPFYKLAPLKLEELSTFPEVTMIYDIISDNEAQMIIEGARPQLSHDKYKPDFCKYFMYDKKSEITVRLTKRLANLYGLEHSERFQMTAMNYGIAGNSVPIIEAVHETAEEKNTPTLYGSFPTLFRYITAQIFLSDVTQGGNVVFPYLNLIVPPKKNAMIIWLRNMASGTADYRTPYAACPVIRGSKWVARLQVFTGPCGLIYEVEEGLVRVKDPFKAITNKNLMANRKKNKTVTLN